METAVLSTKNRICVSTLILTKILRRAGMHSKVAATVVVALLAEVMAETMTAVIRNLLVSAWILTMDSWTSGIMGVINIPRNTIVADGLMQMVSKVMKCAASAEEDPPPEK